MNIIYINGYNGENSSKPSQLEELGFNVKHIKIKYTNGFFNKETINSIIEEIKEFKADFIIASSMGSYIARFFANELNIPLISLNPVIDYKETLSKIGVQDLELPKIFTNYPIEHYVICNSDDELIDVNSTINYYHNKSKIIILEKGGHKMNNFKEVMIEIKSIIESHISFK